MRRAIGIALILAALTGCHAHVHLHFDSQPPNTVLEVTDDEMAERKQGVPWFDWLGAARNGVDDGADSVNGEPPAN